MDRVGVFSILKTMEPATLERYLTTRELSPADVQKFALFSDSFVAWLDETSAADATRAILAELQKVYELCASGSGRLARAYVSLGLDFPVDVRLSELAMRLLLDHEAAFDFAHSRQQVQSTGSGTAVYRLSTPAVDVTEQSLEHFREGVSEWFRAEGKGEQCIVAKVQGPDELLIVVERGHFAVSKPFWEGARIEVDSRRPTVEDVLCFDHETSELRVKSTNQKDRETLLRLFALHIVGDGAVADRALAERVFDLGPIQGGTFSYSGAGAISRVNLVGAKIRVRGMTKLVVKLDADNLAKSFEFDTGSLSLQSGELISVRLCFHIVSGRRETTATFTIGPPNYTDLGERSCTRLVLDYLRQQQVMLR